MTAPRFQLILSLLVVAIIGLGCERPADLGDAASPAPDRTAVDEPVILVSIDGMRHDYLELHGAPTLEQLRDEGAYVARFIASFPTKTFPNHYTLVTGLHPGNHGVVSNSMYDPEFGERFSMGNDDAVTDGKWWDDGEPIWVTAEQQGRTAATYFWPGSEAEIDGTRPSHWLPYDGRVPGNDRVDQVLEWLELPEAERPSFLTLYFSKVDSRGHRHGPASEEVAQALREVDGYIQRLFDGLDERGIRANVLIGSDHGMAPISPDRTILMDEHIDTDDVFIVDYTPVAMMNTRDGVDPAPIVEALDALDRVDAYHRDDVPADLHFEGHRRIPEIIAIAEDTWSLSTTDYFERNRDRLEGGAHGYPPQNDSMQSLLIAHGPAFEAGKRIDTLQFVDLYPLMTHLLDLNPAPHDGSLEAAQRLLNPEYAPVAAAR